MEEIKMTEKDVKTMNIFEKMLAIKEDMGFVPKQADGFHYKYVSEDTLQYSLSRAMIKYNVLLRHNIMPETVKVETIEIPVVNEKTGLVKTNFEYRFSAITKYTWVNVDNPSETLEDTYAAVGQMSDVSQAFGAAETYSNRYYIMKAFQIPTPKDDPDYILNLTKRAEEGGDAAPAPEKKTNYSGYGKASGPYNRPAASAHGGVSPAPAPTPSATAKPSVPAGDLARKLNEVERREMFDSATKKYGSKPQGAEYVRGFIKNCGVSTSADLTKAQYDEFMGMINGADDVPFPDSN